MALLRGHKAYHYFLAQIQTSEWIRSSVVILHWTGTVVDGRRDRVDPYQIILQSLVEGFLLGELTLQRI